MTQIATHYRGGPRVVVTQFEDFAIVEEVEESVHESTTQVMPIVDLCALLDLSVWTETKEKKS